MFEPEKWEKSLERASAIAVVPKERFTEWVAAVAPSHPLNWPVDRILGSREPTVWIIPSTGNSRDHEHFQDFLNDLKRSLMASEFREISGEESAWPPSTLDAFDLHFDLLVYDHFASCGYLRTNG